MTGFIEKIAISAHKMCAGGRASATMGAMNKRELARAVAVQADVELKTVVTSSTASPMS